MEVLEEGYSERGIPLGGCHEDCGSAGPFYTFHDYVTSTKATRTTDDHEADPTRLVQRTVSPEIGG